MTAAQQDCQNAPQTVVRQRFFIVDSGVHHRMSSNGPSLGGLMDLFKRLFNEFD